MSWIPALAIGFGLGVPLQWRIHGTRGRKAVLSLAGPSSIVTILRAIF